MKGTYADPHDPLPTAARAGILSLLGGICGVTPGNVGLVKTDPTGTLLRITYTGWSPSLHAVDYDIEAFSPWQPDDPRLHRLPCETLERALDVQRRRLEAGVAIGLHRPLEAPRPAFVGVQTSHLVASRALIDLANALGHDFGEDIQEDLANLHHSDEADGLSEDLGDDRSWVSERKLRELVEVHPVLDGMRMAAIENASFDEIPELRIKFEPDLVAVPRPGRRSGENT